VLVYIFEKHRRKNKLNTIDDNNFILSEQQQRNTIMTTPLVLDGKALAKKIEEELKPRVEAHKKKTLHRPPTSK
jgi:hypothetical protein